MPQPAEVIRARAGAARQRSGRALVAPLLIVAAGVVPVVHRSTVPAAAQTDLDVLMRQVLSHRDDNWKKLQQYILDEHERIELRGPDRQPIWGEDREYTWYVRDGFFVRSPLKVNGAAVPEADRRRYESDYLGRQKRREERQRQPEPGDSPQANEDRGGPPSIDSFIRQIRQPQFISTAYFLRFRFEPGQYALVGREQIEGRDMLRIEYYPTRLYSDEQRRRQATSHDRNDPYDAEIQRMLNKVALVTLWIEPTAQQIVKYTFDNIDFDFLPARWLVRLDAARASMTMGQPFPDVWLPRDIEMSGRATFASGPIDVEYSLAYHDYRQPDVKTKVRVPKGR